LGFELFRAVKTYNHQQHQKLDRLLNDNGLLRSLEYQSGQIDPRGINNLMQITIFL